MNDLFTCVSCYILFIFMVLRIMFFFKSLFKDKGRGELLCFFLRGRKTKKILKISFCLLSFAFLLPHCCWAFLSYFFLIYLAIVMKKKREREDRRKRLKNMKPTATQICFWMCQSSAMLYDIFIAVSACLITAFCETTQSRKRQGWMSRKCM